MQCMLWHIEAFVKCMIEDETISVEAQFCEMHGGGAVEAPY